MSTRPGAALRERYLEVVASIYIYNEFRGYSSLDRVLEAVRLRCPDDPQFIAAIARHREDERKHYMMFRRWFELRGTMPFTVDAGFGHIDHFILAMFGVPIEQLDTEDVVADPHAFEELCRVIALTEERGLAQVEILLKNRIILSDPAMQRIFEVVHRDEPGHFLPYQAWLRRHGRPQSRWRERAADWSIHKLLMLWKLPRLFLDPGAARLARWPDQA